MKAPILNIPIYVKIFQKYLGSKMYFVVPMSLLTSILEGVGILMLMPLLNTLFSGDFSELDGINLIIYQAFNWLGGLDFISWVLIIIVFLFTIKAFISFLALRYIAYLRAELLRVLKIKLYKKHSEMSYKYYLKHNIGHFVNTVNEQVNRSLLSFSALVQVFVAFINLLIFSVLIFLVSYEFGILMLIVGLCTAALFNRLSVRVRNISLKSAQESRILEGLLIQNANAFKYFLSTGQTLVMKSVITESVLRLSRYQSKTEIAAGLVKTLREPVSTVIVLLVLYVQVVLLNTPLESAIVLIILLHRGVSNLFFMQKKLQGFLGNIGSFEKVCKEFEHVSENKTPVCKNKSIAFSGDMALDNIYFSYKHNGPCILNGVNLTIKEKSSYAIVGKSGSGKSTLVDIIALLHKPDKGKIKVGELFLENEYQCAWRKRIGYVSQDMVIFNDTVANNISLDLGKVKADKGTLKRIKAAAEQACISDDIDNFSEGYDTHIGDRGSTISDGQKQRIFIARELFRRPKVLILDEATSSLDYETEKEVQTQIDNLKGHVTLIVIAHRLNTVNKINNIIVLDKGKIVEKGIYSDLIREENSIFKNMVNNNLSKEI